MIDFRHKIRTKLFRRSSAVVAPASTNIYSDRNDAPSFPLRRSSPSFKAPKSSSSKSLRNHSEPRSSSSRQQCQEATTPAVDSRPVSPKHEDFRTTSDSIPRPQELMLGERHEGGSKDGLETPALQKGTAPAPEVVVQEPTPDAKPELPNPISTTSVPHYQADEISRKKQLPLQVKLPADLLASKKPLFAKADLQRVHAPLGDGQSHIPATTPQQPMDVALPPSTSAIVPNMHHRKIWVKRPTGAATIVLVRDDEMVDEAKDAILQKFRNSLGKHFDAPDVTIRIFSRDGTGERVLSPDEVLCRTLEAYYPGGQTLTEALVIDVPQKHRTPKPSPRAHAYAYYYPEDSRPHESGTDYFPLMPATANSPAITSLSHESRHSHPAHERAMSVLNTGQVPPLPSPGGSRHTRPPKHARPNYGRQPTSSPTALTSSVSSRQPRPRVESAASAEKQPVGPQAPPLPTPSGPEAAKAASNPGTPRVSSPRPFDRRKAKHKPANADSAPVFPPAIIDTAVPPINVLIVEDNHINMKLLEQFVRRLKVRWDTAVNGREAVNKWRKGGFHLVLMDIQLPIMSGLEATKEIRRLERVNNIGAFSNTPSEVAGNGDLVDGTASTVNAEDKLGDPERLFKSPVIIVALTASNLQSDRHEALAAGCNDFLTKPVNFVWFERKVKEWGCMQALIDFDGWRKWKDFAAANGLKDASSTPSGGLALPAMKKPTLTTPAASANSNPSPAVSTSPTSTQQKRLSADGSDAGASKSPATGIDQRIHADGDTDGDRKGETKLLGSQALTKEDSPDTVIDVSNSSE